MKEDLGIGVFDSGVGGLTVLRAVRAALPCERLFYLGDTARVPYGNKAPETVRRYTVNSARFLAKRGIKALVIACNTASAFGMEAVEASFDVPVVGVIEPAAELAVASTRSGVIGVIGTRGTISSQAYPRAITHRRPDVQVVQQACPLFVPLAEEGWCDDDVAARVAERYLAPFCATDIDTLILGCTHYPLLRHTISQTLERLLGRSVTVVDSAAATAQRLRALLDAEGARRVGEPEDIGCFVTDDVSRFKAMADRFLGQTLQRVEHVDLLPSG